MSRPRYGSRTVVAVVLVLAVLVAVGVVVTRHHRAERPAAGTPFVLREDFDTPAAEGSFADVYARTMSVYPRGWRDTSGVGVYRPDDVLSVADGVLTFRLRTLDGEPAVGAVVPVVPGGGQLYGRFSVRLRADAVPGYKLAFLLWPDSERWPDDGEIDFPDAPLDEQFSAYLHHADPDGSVEEFPAGTTFEDWHTATIEWSPGRVEFLLDGVSIGSSTTGVPDTSMHFVLQAETDTAAADPRHAPDPAAEARVLVDRVVVEGWPWAGAGPSASPRPGRT